MGSVSFGIGANWVTYSNFANWGLWIKGALCLTLNTSGMLCRRFAHFWGDFCGCLGRVSVGTTVNNK